jgi:hypothetical protein
MFQKRLGRFVCLACGLTLLVLAGCASATPLPATATLAPTLSFTATTPPTTAATATAAPTLAVSPTLAASATEADTATAAASATLAATSTAAATLTPLPPTVRPTAAEFTPQEVSVWDTELAPAADQMSGTCSNPVNPVYGLVQVTPQGNSLQWKNQEPAPYTMARVRANLYQYSGPSSLGDGTLTMVVQFTSPTTLLLTRTFVSTAEPNCTHLHTYTGVFKWNK